MRRTEANQTAGERPPRHRINEIVSDVLGAAIELGALPSGGVLRDSVVAAAFEVSRAPIRRALARLERQGLVSPVTGGGYLIVGRAAGNEVLTEHRIRGTISPENRSAAPQAGMARPHRRRDRTRDSGLPHVWTVSDPFPAGRTLWSSAEPSPTRS